MATVFGVIQHFNREESTDFSFWNCALLVGAFSVSHIVFFGLLGLGLGISCLFQLYRTKSFFHFAQATFCLLLALGFAFFAGGFLGLEGVQDNHITFERDFFEESFGQRLLHHLVLFGVPFLSLPVLLYKAVAKPKLNVITVSSITIIGFLIPNLMSYERSWDIVKFLGVAMFFTNCLLAIYLPSFNLSKTALASVLLLCSLTSALWLTRISVMDGQFGIPKMHFPPPQPIAEKTARYLKPFLSPADRVFSTNIDMSKAGLLTPGFNWRQFGRGYIMNRQVVDLQLQAAQRIRRHLPKADLRRLNIRYLILSPSDIRGLSEQGKKRLHDRESFSFKQEIVSHGQKRFIYEVLLR